MKILKIRIWKVFFIGIRKDVIMISDKLSNKISTLPNVEWIEKAELFAILTTEV